MLTQVQNTQDFQQIYRIVVNNLFDGIYLVDKEKHIIVWNDAAYRITGYSQSEMLEQEFAIDLLDYVDHTGAAIPTDFCPIHATLQDGRQRTCELFFKHKKGYRVPVIFKTAPIVENKEIVAVMAIFTNSNAHTKLRQSLMSTLSQLVMTDQLTGLPNSHYTEMLLQSRLEDFRTTGTNFGLLYISLDDFDICNETFGYEAGNEVLAALADAFAAAIRDSDFIGRWSSEEFLGCFEAKSTQHLKSLMEKIRGLVAHTQIQHQEEIVSVTASIGATMARPGDTSKGLTERAMSLMHVSKISGRNCATIG